MSHVKLLNPLNARWIEIHIPSFLYNYFIIIKYANETLNYISPLISYIITVYYSGARKLNCTRKM